MIQILITGANSYIGSSFGNWVSQWPEQYEVDTIDMRSDEWKNTSFSSYDVIYHIAAIVHIKENDPNKYFQVNRDLAVEVAQKAKKEGIKQFVFLSTMGVYGTETGSITVNTKPNPKTLYAKSKLEAETSLIGLSDSNFKVAILRPPIVYGNNCSGNYSRLASLAKKLPVFPKINNERSMIFIDNLSEFVRKIIDFNDEGLFFPQNREYVNTSELVKLVAEAHSKDLRLTRIINPFVNLGIKLSGTFGKVFGTFTYDKKMPGGPDDAFEYEVCSFKESIKRTEK